MGYQCAAFREVYCSPSRVFLTKLRRSPKKIFCEKSQDYEVGVGGRGWVDSFHAEPTNRRTVPNLAGKIVNLFNASYTLFIY